MEKLSDLPIVTYLTMTVYGSARIQSQEVWLQRL